MMWSTAFHYHQQGQYYNHPVRAVPYYAQWEHHHQHLNVLPSPPAIIYVTHVTVNPQPLVVQCNCWTYMPMQHPPAFAIPQHSPWPAGLDTQNHHERKRKRQQDLVEHPAPSGEARPVKRAVLASRMNIVDMAVKIEQAPCKPAMEKSTETKEADLSEDGQIASIVQGQDAGFLTQLTLRPKLHGHGLRPLNSVVPGQMISNAKPSTKPDMLLSVSKASVQLTRRVRQIKPSSAEHASNSNIERSVRSDEAMASAKELIYWIGPQLEILDLNPILASCLDNAKKVTI